MKVGELWLRSLIDPPSNIQTIGAQLTHAGIEVDFLESLPLLFPLKSQDTDVVLTLKTPANRGDCLSMEGIAREVSALTQIPYHPIQIKKPIPKIVDLFPIHIHAPQACPRYIGRVIQHIRTDVKTPDWMQNRLHLAGLRPISPVVDITNYVMLEMGQPLHAFDLAELQNEIVVRFARAGERIVVLDDQTITLREDTLVIADQSGPQAIAGIIGGKQSSVTEVTQDILLECAYFDPIGIRFTARQYGLRTESSIRFERGIDFNLQMRAIERASELLEEIVGGNVGPLIEVGESNDLKKNHTILLREDRIRQILGIDISTQAIETILHQLEIPYLIDKENFLVTPPSFRVDLLEEEDLIEEIIRIYGYQNIPAQMPEGPIHPSPIPEDKLTPANIADVLKSRGYAETITYSFVSSASIEQLNPKALPLILTNPISSDMNAMRTSLWPGLIQAFLHNQRRQQSRIRIFEMGTCFFPNNNTHDERVQLAGLCSGTLLEEQWGSKAQPIDFFDIKADLQALIALTGHEQQFKFVPGVHPTLHPGQAAQILKDDKAIGWIGALNPAIIQALDIQSPNNIFVFELDLDPLLNRAVPKFEDFSRYPVIRRDIAILVEKSILAEEIKSIIVEAAGSLLRETLIFDVYQGKGIEPTKKSIALGLFLQHPTRTLVDDEVNTVVDKIILALKTRVGATLRD